MNPKYFLQLIVLAAIWGSSFLFMRIAVPALGPSWMVELRLLGAALFLFATTRFICQPLDARQNWKHYLVLGTFNTAFPFFAFAWAAQFLPASILAILNSTAPLWGVVVGFVWRGNRISGRGALGLGFGVIGVASLVGLGDTTLSNTQLTAVGVCLLAAICYGIASVYAGFAKHVQPFANAHGSLWAAVLLITPITATQPIPGSWPPGAIAAALALGLFCTGVAYLMYYHLIATIGAWSAMTVGYLIPLFGVFWGWLFLGEEIGLHTLAGAALVLIGTALVTGLNVRSLFRRRPLASNEN